MRRLVLPGVLALCASLTAFAFTPPASPGPGAIKTMLEGMFKAIDAGDRAAAQACLVDKDSAFPVLIYDSDLDDQPVAIEGLEGARHYLDSIFDALKKDDIKVASRITKINADCNSPDLGYATLEFTQAFTQGGKTETHDYRATALVTWGKDQSKGPKIFHWHASLAKPAAATGGKPDAKK